MNSSVAICLSICGFVYICTCVSMLLSVCKFMYISLPRTHVCVHVHIHEYLCVNIHFYAIMVLCVYVACL